MSDTFGLNGLKYGGNLRDHPVNLVFCRLSYMRLSYKDKLKDKVEQWTQNWMSSSLSSNSGFYFKSSVPSVLSSTGAVLLPFSQALSWAV